MGNITNLVKGGVGDTAAPENIDPTQLALGIQIEMEHTNDERIAKEIATDHLSEHPDYYTKLAKAGLAHDFTSRPNSGYGDPDAPFNDAPRTGNTDNRYTNMGGKIGGTSSGQVSGRRSEPVHNKTIDIELEEEAFDPTISTAPHDSGTYNSGNDFIGIAEMKTKISKIREYIKKLAREERLKEIGFAHQTPNSPLKYLSLTQKRAYELIQKFVKKIYPNHFEEADRALSIILSLGPDELESNTLEYITRFVNKVTRKEYPEGFVEQLLGLAHRIYNIEDSDISENMKKTKLSLKDQLRNLINEELSNLNSVMEQDTDDLEVDAEDNEVTITLDKGLAQAIYDALTDVLEIEDEEGEEDGEAAPEAPDASVQPSTPTAPAPTPEPSTQPAATTAPATPKPATEPEPETSTAPEEEEPEEESPTVKEAKKWVYESKVKNLLKKNGVSIDKLQLATKKGGKLGQRSRLASTLKKMK